MEGMTLTEYYDVLDKHDWFYDFSDDRKVRRKGQQKEHEIMMIASAYGDKYLALYQHFHLHHFSGDSFNLPKAPKPERPQEETNA